ncbi:hypothetical protein [Lysinibacillus sp. CTST325]
MIVLNGGKEELPKTDQVESKAARLQRKSLICKKNTQKTAADMSVSAAVL